MTTFDYLKALDQAIHQAVLEVNQRLTKRQLQELDDLNAQLSNDPANASDELEDTFEQVWRSPMPTMNFVRAEQFERKDQKLWHVTYLHFEDDYAVLIAINFLKGCDPEVTQHGIPIPR